MNKYSIVPIVKCKICGRGTPLPYVKRYGMCRKCKESEE